MSRFTAGTLLYFRTEAFRFFVNKSLFFCLQRVHFLLLSFEFWFVAGGKNPKMPYLAEAARQDMQAEAPLEFDRIQGHDFRFPSVAVIFAGETDLPVVNAVQAMITVPRCEERQQPPYRRRGIFRPGRKFAVSVLLKGTAGCKALGGNAGRNYSGIPAG